MKLAVTLLLLLALIVLLARYLRSIGFALRRTAGRSVPVESECEYVVRVLTEFLSGDGRPWDWDNFMSCSLEDPALEAIRRKATAVELPPDEHGIAALSELLAQAEGEADTA